MEVALPPPPEKSEMVVIVAGSKALATIVGVVPTGVFLPVPAAAGAPEEEISELTQLPSPPTPYATALANPTPTLDNIDDLP